MSNPGAAGASSVWSRASVTLEMIKIGHSVFALPFALGAMLLAADGHPSARVVLWVVVAMVTSRSAAMAFNRLVDHSIDGRNPRTLARALPAGLVTRRFVLLFIVLQVGLFVTAAGMLNPLCLALTPVALAVILGYSYAKRFTVLCHLWLGLALGITPLAGWIAVTGVVDSSILTPAGMAVAVLFWVAGFDVIYGCQDASFDREVGLHSIPARVGVPRALQLAAAFHLTTVAALLLLQRFAGLGIWYGTSVALVSALLLVEHVIARSGDGSRLQVAFFHVNSTVGFVFLAGILGELYA